MSGNVTNVTVLNQVDLSVLESEIITLNNSIATTNNLIMYVIVGYFLLLFFRNVGRVYNPKGAKK